MMADMKTFPRITRHASIKGFTMVELMVVVAIVAVVASVAVPSFKKMVTGSGVRAAVNDWTLAMQTARSEAVRQRTPVILCPSADGATCATTSVGAFAQGWIVQVVGSATILQDYPPVDRVTMTVVNAAGTGVAGSITFLPNGLPIGTFGGYRVIVAENSASPDSTLTRNICVARSGRVRVFNETDYLALSAGKCLL